MKSITTEMLAKYRDAYENDRFAQILTAAAARSDLDEIAYVRKNADKLNGSFSIEIETHGITAQERSGRCWMYAGMNLLREVVIKKYKLEEFEFSGNYLEFYDKLEKVNNTLEMAIEYANEPLTSQMNKHLLTGIGDGGDWDMFTALVKKYGMVPKTAMDESFISGHTERFLIQLNHKVKEDMLELRRMVIDGIDPSARKEEMMGEYYRMECIVFGEPVETFDFCTRDEDKNFIGGYKLTPRTFYDEYVGVNLDDYAAITSMPYTSMPLGKYYEYHYGGNMVGSNITCLNLTKPELKEMTLKQLQNGELVLFSCDSRKYLDRALGVWDPACFDYTGVLGIDAHHMTLTEELDTGVSFCTHCMVFTGVNINAEGKTDRWKIENSWGKEAGREGYFVCSDAYFDRYVYQAIILKKYLNEDQLALLNGEPTMLNPWDIEI